MTDDIGSPKHFHPAAKSLHWITAALLLVIWPLGYFGVMAAEASAGGLFFWHKSLGFLLLWIMVLRLSVRALTARPGRPAEVNGLARTLAALNQWLLYGALIAQPVLGYLLVVTHARPFVWFGVVTLPSLTGDRPELHETVEQFHQIIGWAILWLFLLHLAGVLYHRVIRRDDTLARMT